MRFVFRLFCFVLFNMLTLSLSAQDRDSVDLFLPDTVRAVPVVDSVGTAQKDTVVRATRVYLVHADSLSFDRERNADAQVLNVMTVLICIATAPISLRVPTR